MKIRLAAHLTCAAVCLGLLFADQGRLASVLYFLYLGVEVFISAVTASSATMASGRRRQPWRMSTLLPCAPMLTAESASKPEQGIFFRNRLQNNCESLSLAHPQHYTDSGAIDMQATLTTAAFLRSSVAPARRVFRPLAHR